MYWLCRSLVRVELAEIARADHVSTIATALAYILATTLFSLYSSHSSCLYSRALAAIAQEEWSYSNFETVLFQTAVTCVEV